jgi:imidazolonepropionase
MNMTPEEAVTALTINAAAAVDMDDKIGSIETGKQGDLIIISGPSYRYIPYYIGVNTVETVVKKGKVVVNKKEGLQCW